MNSMQGVKFGSLTAKQVGYMSFEEIDINKDGFITEEEINSLFNTKQFDILDLSTIDKDADKKVTKQEYEFWQQEAEIQSVTDSLKKQAIRDFIGHDEEDIKNVLKMIDEYKTMFIQNFQKTGNIVEMAERYKQKLPAKYIEIKQYAMQNTKSAIKNRVVEKIVQEVIDDSKNANKEYSGIIKESAFTLSDNARRILGNELSKEAEKYIKTYDADNLEEDLALHLRTFLQNTDKSKLSDAIYAWENSKDKLEHLSLDAAFQQMKNNAKNFLLFAIDQGVNITLKNITVRTEVAIVPALAQYKNSAELQDAIDKIISQLSKLTKLEQIKDMSNVTKVNPSENNEKNFSPDFNVKNIFYKN